MSADAETKKFRALFISDVHGHEGLSGRQASRFSQILQAERIYLVGDIVDGWALKNGWYWPQAHNDVVQKLLQGP